MLEGLWLVTVTVHAVTNSSPALNYPKLHYFIYDKLILWVQKILPQICNNYCILTACYMQAVGVASSDAFPDSSFSASSEFDYRYVASNGRLNRDIMAWAPRGNDKPDYLQIDLQYEYVICAVATQGAAKNSEWTTKYKIKLSLDGTNFDTYQENNVDKVGLISCIQRINIG